MSAPVAVVVGLLAREDGSLLLCQRPPGKSYALEWEFPGGKVEPGERPEQALVRELQEELGIETVLGPLLHEKVSFYADGGNFAVAYYLVESWSGDITNRVFADLHWVRPERLPEYPILSGNREICERLAQGGSAGLLP